MSINDKILKLKKEKNALILAHNYQLPEVQDIADFTGDSLELSRKAAGADNELIVFCGVYFMAETAAILSPRKTVLIPDRHAGCPMVDMTPLSEVVALKEKHPGAVVVSYVNSSAEVKAISDYCCTSANAVDVVRRIPENKQVVFVPDRHLGSWTMEQTGRDLVLYPGYCPTHAKIPASDIERAKSLHPEALVIVHPECPSGVRALADAVLSTGGMCKYVAESKSSSFIVGTENDMLHRLRKENPRKQFFEASAALVCPNMKKITLEKVLWSLEDMEFRVIVEKDVADRARTALERMVSILPES